MAGRVIQYMSTESESRFDDVFNRFYTDIFRYCLRRLDHGEAEDATAEVFAVVWRRLDDLPEGAGTRAWLMSVAYHTVGNRYRGRRRRRRTTDYLAGLRNIADEPPDQTLRMEEEKAVLQALSQLSPSDQELLRLDSWERLSIGEIAAILGLRENTAAQRLSRARSRFKSRFERIYGNSSTTIEKGENHD